MDHISYLALRIFTYPFALMPYWMIHKIGTFLGTIAYYLLTSFRKRAQSNLALAYDLSLSPEKIKSIAKGSFQNLMITCLEYAKFHREKEISRAALCLNPHEAKALIDEGKGVIFFCGHQSNWEVLFLEGTSRMPGVAIGKPVKNKFLYNWVLSIRQKFGGTIITPKNAIKEGIRALRQGKFLGIVGDQGMPDSGFCSPFLGRMAWTSPIPAILSYRTQRPIIVATTLRQNGKYLISYSDAIWPDLSEPMEKQIPILMHKALLILEKTIKEHPEQWLWQHNRWKQQLPGVLRKKFRQDSLLLILPKKKEHFDKVKSSIAALRRLFPSESLLIYAPYAHKRDLQGVKETIVWYETESDVLQRDFRCKLVINFLPGKRIKKHYMKLSAFDVLSFQDLLCLSAMNEDCSIDDILNQALTHART